MSDTYFSLRILLVLFCLNCAGTSSNGEVKDSENTMGTKVAYTTDEFFNSDDVPNPNGDVYEFIDASISLSDAGHDCGETLRITVRDFTNTHPDFEKAVADDRGLVEKRLGADKKPVYAPQTSTSTTSGKDSFDQWYRDVPGINMVIPVDIQFDETSPGVFVYDNSEFFPIDDKGFGNGISSEPWSAEAYGHNFLFTTEIHTQFTYKGGELFTFRGDDDLWVFINDRLVIDIGGVHPAQELTADLDALVEELDIQKGETYPMDIFHAERHTGESNFRIETTIDMHCIVNIPPLG